MKIMKEFRNNLLKRREITAIIDSKNNPGYETSINNLTEQFKVEKDLVVIKSLRSKFGQNSFLVEAYIYDSIQDKERIEPKKKEKKSKAGEVKK